jgi:UDP-glucose 4-epimerase
MIPKKVLITGAAGFIGNRLVERLREGGAEVYGTSRLDRGNDLSITWYQGSLDDLNTAQRVLEEIQPNIIYHLAGMATASNSVTNVLPTYHSLVTSTVNLLTIAAALDCQRIILVGSTNEPSHQDPNSPYAAAKSAATMYGRLFQKLYKLPLVIARTSVAYGPGQPSDKLIPYVMSHLLNAQRPKLSTGAWKTDWIYIDDVVDGLFCCATVPNIEGETIDIGTGQYTSVREVVEKLVHIMEPPVTPLFGVLPDRHAEYTPVADTAKTWEKLHWKAKTSIEEGLRKTVAFIKNAAKGGRKFVLSK